MRILSVLLLLFSFLGARSQQDSTKILNEVIVTAYKSNRPLNLTPTSVGVIQKNDFSRFGNSSFVPAVNTIPGVRMEERSPGSYRLSIRGSLLRSPFGIRNVKFYWNGLPLTDGGGNTYFNLLDLNSVDRIEVIKGPGASLYGAGTGGVVLLNSNLSDDSRINYSILGGSYGLFKLQTNGKIINTKKSSVSLGTSYQRSDGYREQTEMKRFSTHLDWKYQINNANSLSTTLFSSNLFYETPGGLTKSQFEDDPSQARPATLALPGAKEQKASVKNITTYAGTMFNHDWSNQWTTQFGLFASMTDFKNPSIRNYEKRSENNWGGRTETQGNFQTNEIKWKVTLGGEYQHFFSPVDVYDNNYGKRGSMQVSDKLWSSGGLAFAQTELELPNQIIATVGVSANFLQYKFKRVSESPVVNQTRKFDAEFFPRLAILKKVNKSISVFGSISSGFSPPTIAEVRPSTGNFNNDLKPENGINLEGGIRGKVGKQFLFDVVFFDFKLHDAIVIQRTADGAEYFINSGDTKQYGLETTFKWTSKNITATYWNVWASYTMNNFSFGNYYQDGVDYSNNQLTGVAPNVVVVGVDFISKSGLYINTTFNYTDRIPLNDANSEYAADYYLLGSRIGMKKTKLKVKWDFFLGVDNALNQTYSLGNDLNAAFGRYYNAAPPRNYYVGVNISF